MLNRAKQESVTVATLNLLQKTVDYLNRLPVVPITRELIREIDAHLAAPETKASRREAEVAELLSSKRVAGRYTPCGQIAFSVVVEGGKVTITAPENSIPPGHLDKRMEQLANGITMDLVPYQEARPIKANTNA